MNRNVDDGHRVTRHCWGLREENPLILPLQWRVHCPSTLWVYCPGATIRSWYIVRCSEADWLEEQSLPFGADAPHLSPMVATHLVCAPGHRRYIRRAPALFSLGEERMRSFLLLLLLSTKWSCVLLALARPAFGALRLRALPTLWQCRNTMEYSLTLTSSAR